MKKIILAIIAISSVVSTGALAARIPYGMLQLPSPATCTTNVPGTCEITTNTSFLVEQGIFYYDTVSHQLVAKNSFDQQNLQFINNKATISTCVSNPPSGNAQPEPISYCQNPQNYFDLTSQTLTYHPDSQLITVVGSDYYTFDNNGSTGWVKMDMSGLKFGPSNAL